MSQSPVLPPTQRSWTSLATSATVHLALITLAVALSTREPPPEETAPERRTEPSRQVDMIYLPPPPARPPPAAPPPPSLPQPPPTRPSAPPPPQRQPVPEDRANAPPDAVRSEGEEADEAEGASDPEAAREVPPEDSRAAAPTMESEALRIFGRRRIATRPGAGPRATRPMESYIPDRPDKCVPSPAPADSTGAVQFGTVVGKIYRQDGGTPLAGAHLQMLGTPYVAFTDSEGEYRFRFDLSLMDDCRTQYVRVTAKGYESRLLVLLVGQNVRSEDVRLEKRSGWPGL
ncbi:MAG: carboxypeptidase regulatory-like domain-containing protein [Gemmatimonadales bacterium]|nr:carboxypeptidase regulatory-like domain-containing protein [Gemmatimonadales bacterium]